MSDQKYTRETHPNIFKVYDYLMQTEYKDKILNVFAALASQNKTLEDVKDMAPEQIRILSKGAEK